MVYKVIGLMSGSSMDGLDIAFVELHESKGKWEYNFIKTACLTYSDEWVQKLSNATRLTAKEYLLLHSEYGHWLGAAVNRFIEENNLSFQVYLVASHGHTVFHVPGKMTAQLGDGAAIAAETGINVVSDLRSLDIAFGGQGAPIVPIGEKLLFSGYDHFLNLGGIANISADADASAGLGYIAFDICSCNRVLNMLAIERNMKYDEGGRLARSGKIVNELMSNLNELDYYKQTYPKSLANEFGSEVVYSVIKRSGSSIEDALRTYVEHIAIQVKNAIDLINQKSEIGNRKLLVTGGGAFNNFLVERITEHLQPLNVEVIVPDEQLVNYKEALVMALIGVLRLRQENNVLSSVTGSTRDSIGGALWMGQEA